MGEDRCGGRAVAGAVGGLGSDLPHERCAHIFELVLEFDLLGHGNPILRHAGRAEGPFDEGIAAFGAKRDPHRMGKDFDPAQHFVARFA